MCDYLCQMYLYSSLKQIWVCFQLVQNPLHPDASIYHVQKNHLVRSFGGMGFNSLIDSIWTFAIEPTLGFRIGHSSFTPTHVEDMPY